MALHLYDSQSRTLQKFTARNPGKAGIYLCGATVQSAPHVGHLRSAIAFDVLGRWLTRSGYEVTFVRNVTDIDDKILAKSAEEGRPWWAHAYLYEREFTAAYAAVNIVPVTYEPRATGHVVEMIELMQRLIERGHAYQGDEGNVYFSVRSLPSYGSLTHQQVDQLGEGGTGDDDAPLSDKKDPLDFALWKAVKPGEPHDASWNTPFGRGRPGWHLECSAMAHRYLGEDFDIHCGGIDLRFPHHENEQAQSHAAGWGFTNYWLHNAWVTVAGEKMGKSLGNALLVSNILSQANGQVVRYALGGTHYRSTIEFTPGESLTEAQAAWDRIAGFVERANSRSQGQVASANIAKAELPSAYVAAMDDDLNVSAALAVVHEWVRAGNTALAEGQDDQATSAAIIVRSMLEVLGLDPYDSAWQASHSSAESTATHAALDSLIQAQLQARDAARTQKDWARADEIRDQLLAAGVIVADSADGPTWSIKEGPHGR